MKFSVVRMLRCMYWLDGENAEVHVLAVWHTGYHSECTVITLCGDCAADEPSVVSGRDECGQWP